MAFKTNEWRDRLKELSTDLINVIRKKDPAKAEALRQKFDFLMNMDSCFVLLGNTKSLSWHAPEEAAQVKWDGNMVHSYRPGEEYSVHVETKPGHASLRTVTTPLSTHATVLGGELSFDNLSRKTSIWMPFLRDADAVIILQKELITEEQLETLSLLCQLREQLIGMGGAEIGQSGEMPIIYVHHIEPTMDPLEGHLVCEQNLAALSAREIAIQAAFEIQEDQEDHKEYERLKQHLNAIDSMVQNMIDTQMEAELIEVANTSRDDFATQAEHYSHLAGVKINYEQIINQRESVIRLIEDGTHLESACEKLEQVLATKKQEIMDSFRLIDENETGKPSIFANTIGAFKDNARLPEKIKRLKQPSKKKRAEARYNRGRMQATRSLATDSVALIGDAIIDLNKIQIQIHFDETLALDRELKALGFQGLTLPTAHGIEIGKPDSPRIGSLKTTSLMSLPDKIVRVGITGSAGGGIGLATYGSIKWLMQQKIWAMAVEKAIEIGIIAGAPGGPPAQAGCVAIGAVVGVLIAACMIFSQDRKTFSYEVEKKVGEAVGAMMRIVMFHYDLYAKASQKQMQDNIKSMYKSARRACEAELKTLEEVDGRSSEKLQQISTDYSQRTQRIDAVLEAVATIQAERDTRD